MGVLISGPLTPDPKTGDLLTYGRLVVREAQHHGGPGWSEYDKIFRHKMKYFQENFNIVVSVQMYIYVHTFLFVVNILCVYI